MIAFPSESWFDAANQALRTDATLDGAIDGVELVIDYLITGDPPFTYHLRIRQGEARLLPGSGDAALLLRTDAATALALHEGRMASADAVLHGQLVLVGDATALRNDRDSLEAVRAVLDRVTAGPVKDEVTEGSADA